MVGYVTLDRQGDSSSIRYQSRGGLRLAAVDINRYDFGTGFGQDQAEGPSEPAAPAGHHRPPPVHGKPLFNHVRIPSLTQSA